LIEKPLLIDWEYDDENLIWKNIRVWWWEIGSNKRKMGRAWQLKPQQTKPEERRR